ncbi:MAG TPA: hypothetical protein VKO42_00455 [Patescibacteria group bacterium]|nr:hypothetical protein [Patescibacteria group bacterium]
MEVKNKFKKQIKIFLGFAIFGVFLGLVENLLAVSISTDHPLNTQAAVISLLVVIPFAGIGELVVDRINLLPQNRNKTIQHLETILEFMVFGVFMGVVEDLIIINFLTGETITLKTVGIVTLVTLPFAILGEFIVDRHDWFPGIKTKSEKSPETIA